MNRALDLTPEEREQLTTLLKGNAAESASPSSLNGLLMEWTTFVSAVEGGYDDSIYEYTNDLSVRDRLQDLVLAASAGLRAELEAALTPLDERFTATTEPAARPLSAGAGDLCPWWLRVPKNRVGELADDLEAMGHVG